MMVVHVAGTSIYVEHGRMIQRCAICGQKLIDSKDLKPIVIDTGHIFTVNPWPQGGYLKEEEDGRLQLLFEAPEEKDLCLALIEC